MAEFSKKVLFGETTLSPMHNNGRPKNFFKRVSLPPQNNPNLNATTDDPFTFCSEMAESSKKVLLGETTLSPMQNNGRPKNFFKQVSLPPQNNPNLNATTDDNLEKKPEKIINLGLSLGGIYGENCSHKPFPRSSCIIGMLPPKKDHGQVKASAPMSRSFLSLARSCSVPAMAKQEHRKAALVAFAKKRMMRQRNRKGVSERLKSPPAEPMPSSPAKVAAWAAASASRSPALCRALVQIKRQISMYGYKKFEGQGGSTADWGATHPQSLPVQKDAESKLMVGITTNGKPVKVAKMKLGNPPKKAKLLNNGLKDDEMDLMKQMPSVTTTGDGPNGKKIEGFLYKYRTGQVSIVCVCHGSFLSPAEFVRHAGGNDVTNPMKHITVCCSFCS